MAVLIEAISVVIRADAVEDRYPGGWDAFALAAPNQTLCADGEVIRIGFMSPLDVEAFVNSLRQYNILYREHGKARDIAVVDQMRGPLTPCEWINFGQINLNGEPAKQVAACKLAGSQLSKIVTPPGWAFENSLSASYGFVPAEHQHKSLKFTRHENGLDVYLNEVTGKEVFVGRAGEPDRQE